MFKSDKKRFVDKCLPSTCLDEIKWAFLDRMESRRLFKCEGNCVNTRCHWCTCFESFQLQFKQVNPVASWFIQRPSWLNPLCLTRLSFALCLFFYMYKMHLFRNGSQVRANSSSLSFIAQNDTFIVKSVTLWRIYAMPVNERHCSVSNCKISNKDPKEAYNLYMVLNSCHTRGPIIEDGCKILLKYFWEPEDFMTEEAFHFPPLFHMLKQNRYHRTHVMVYGLLAHWLMLGSNKPSIDSLSLFWVFAFSYRFKENSEVWKFIIFLWHLNSHFSHNSQL